MCESDFPSTLGHISSVYLNTTSPFSNRFKVFIPRPTEDVWNTFKGGGISLEEFLEFVQSYDVFSNPVDEATEKDAHLVNVFEGEKSNEEKMEMKKLRVQEAEKRALTTMNGQKDSIKKAKQ